MTTRAEINRSGIEVTSLLDTHRNPFIIIDEHYTILAANQAYCDTYNLTLGRVVGSKCHAISHQHDTPCTQHGEVCPMQTVLADGQQFETTHTRHDSHGQAEQVRVRGYLITASNGRRYLGEEIIDAGHGQPVSTSHPQDIDDMTTPVPQADASIREVEYQHIRRLLEAYHGHRRRVAEILQISERTLYRKIIRYNLGNAGREAEGE